MMHKNFCMAPWTHTYLSPQTERRLCCASREPAQNFQQYIDTNPGSGKYLPITLDDHWNSAYMKNIRRRMLAGEVLSECQVCNDQLLNTDVYRSYFNRLFSHLYETVLDSTDSTGYTTLKPISWDYRFSNLCNFKCRMCGDMLSSSWETEQRQNNMINWHNPKNNWMKPDIRQEITQFQDNQIEAEFSKAVEEHRIQEVYWVGGEPLMYEQHWRYMQRIIELGDGQNVYARYNTNLSRINYRGCNLYNDILDRIRDWQICASLDGTGEIGEYIRTGLNYKEFINNFQQGIGHARHSKQMRLDFTLTLPGMFEIVNIDKLARTLGVEVLAKVIFSFGSDIVLSPLCLPRQLLNKWIDEIIPNLTFPVLKEMLENLKRRATFEEQWPDQYQNGIQQGKQRLYKLESIRQQSITIDKILQGRHDVYKWWQQIPG